MQHISEVLTEIMSDLCGERIGGGMIRFHVHGIPVTQGSMKHIGHGRLIHDKSGALGVWRKSIEMMAMQATRNRKLIDGPCSVDCEFVLPRPASRKRALHADRQPDLDKLARAVGDALEGVVYRNDSRVVRWRVSKRYAEAGEEPGVTIGVEVVG